MNGSVTPQLGGVLTWLREAPAGTLVPAAEVLRRLDEGVATPTPAPPGSNGTTPDRLLTAADVAERLEVSKRYVYANATHWPFTRRLGRAVRFSAAGLDAWLSQSAD